MVGASLADGCHLGDEMGCDGSSQRDAGTGWLLMGTGTGFSLAG